MAMLSADKIRKKYSEQLSIANTLQRSGRIQKVIGLVIESDGPKAPIGEVCNLVDESGRIVSRSEIVGFRDNRILSMVLGELNEISPGMEIVATGAPLSIGISDMLLGRILDGLGEPIDGKGKIAFSEKRPVIAQPPNPLFRARITEPVATGIKSIDGLITLGKGQRIGIFAGSGVGKSTMIGMIARNTSADINVIALIGERGREVREFIENDLGDEGLQRSIVVVATSDAPSLVRVKAALVATTIAEYFRDKGLNVMLMMDSATRLAMAQREVGLTIGEPPTTKGYTPSVFALLQKTMERAGTSISGSITALYTVLVEGDDFNEPISDATRGILDGHVILSRRLATLGHYPAVDVLESISRIMKDVVSKEHAAKAQEIKDLMAIYRSTEDLISVGAYQKGASAKIDKAIKNIDRINAFLKQGISDAAAFEDTVLQMASLIID
jgi:flagellum-specific ATP synthase